MKSSDVMGKCLRYTMSGRQQDVWIQKSVWTIAGNSTLQRAGSDAFNQVFSAGRTYTIRIGIVTSTRPANSMP